MPSQSNSGLDLPFLAPAQARKHITVNEALRRVEAGLYVSVTQMAATALPPEAAPGDAVIIATGTDDADLSLSGRGGQIAVRDPHDWVWFVPRPGWTVWDMQAKVQRIFDGNAWVVGEPSETAARLGLNATASDDQRLAVSSPTTLFNHAGDDHRLLLNRATETDTASLVFQTDFAGEAEFGVTGAAGLRLRTRQDGGPWTDRASFPNDMPGLQSPAFRSVRVSAASGGVVTVPTPASGGIVALTLISDVGFPQSAHTGLFVYDTGASLRLMTLVTLGSIENHDDTVLDGTVASDNHTGISVQDGLLQIENRTSLDRDYSLAFIC